MNFNQLMKKIESDIADWYGEKFVKEAKREQKVSYLHRTTKIPSEKWIKKKRKEHKCTTGAIYEGELVKNWRYNRTKHRIENKTNYAGFVIQKPFISYIHKRIVKGL